MRAHRLIITLSLLALTGCGYSELEANEAARSSNPLRARRAAPGIADIGAAPAYCDPEPVACVTSCGSTGEERCVDGALTGCVVPAEVCDNGLDDDCDGLADQGDSDCPPVLRTCEMADGDQCNGDGGGGDKCDPMDNDVGCAEARFAAWCNRSNPATPGIFEAYARQWVESRCDRDTTKSGDTYGCTSADNYRYECSLR